MKNRERIWNTFSGATYLGSGIVFGILFITCLFLKDLVWEITPNINIYYIIIMVLAIVSILFLILALKHFKSKFIHKIKTPFAIIVGIFLLILSTGGYGYLYTNQINVQPSAQNHFFYDVGPYLTYSGNSSTSITISWTTIDIKQGSLKLGTNPTESIENPWTTYSDTSQARIHHISISELTPNQTYYYHISDFNHDESIHHFRTSPYPQESQFRFAIFGDTQNGGGNIQGVFYNLTEAVMENSQNNGEFDLYLHVGDFVDQGNDLKSWGFSLDQVSRLGGNASFQCAVGNHDVGDKFLSDPEATYFPDQGANYKYFLEYNYVPNEGIMTSMQSRYYSYDYGNAHFIVLDTEVTGDLRADSNQLKWLEEDLQNTASREEIHWIFAYYHRPVFSQYEGINSEFGYFDEKFDHYKFFTPLFDQYGVDAVFQGHVHDYQAYNWTLDENVPFYDNSVHNWEHHNTLYFVTGGGANEYNSDLTPYPKNSEYMMGGQYTDHYMTVDIDGSICTIQSLYVNNSLVLNNQSFTLQKS